MPSMTLLANLQCHLPVVSQGSRSTKGSGKICNAKTCTEPWRPGGGSTSLPSIRRDDKRRRKKRGMKCQGQDRHRDAKIERPVTAVPAISRRRRAPSSCESSQSVSRSSEELITPHSMERRPRTAPQAKKLRQAKASSLIPYPPGGSNLIKAADVTPKAHGGWNGKRPGAKDCSKKKRRVKSKELLCRDRCEYPEVIGQPPIKLPTREDVIYLNYIMKYLEEEILANDSGTASNGV